MKIRSLGAVILEALEELTSNLARYSVVGVTLIGSFAIPSAAEMESIQSRTSSIQGLVGDGALVWNARGETSFSGEACRGLAERPDVLRAGGFSNRGPADLAQAPGAIVNVVLAEHSTIAIWEGAPRRADSADSLLVGSRLANQLGLVSGAAIVVDSTVARVDRVASTARRPGPANRWILTSAVQVALVEECWIELDGQAPQPEVVIDELAADLRRYVANVVVAPSNPAALIEYLLERDDFDSRPSQSYWTISAAVGLAALTAAVLLSRSTVALVLALGSSRLRVTSVYLVVTSALILISSAIGFVLATAITMIRLDGALLRASIGGGFRIVVIGALVALSLVQLVTISSTLRSLSGALKDR